MQEVNSLFTPRSIHIVLLQPSCSKLGMQDKVVIEKLMTFIISMRVDGCFCRLCRREKYKKSNVGEGGPLLVLQANEGYCHALGQLNHSHPSRKRVCLICTA